MYFDRTQYSWSCFITCVILRILLYDTYFYWTHSWMHRPAIFKWIHRIHHQSNNPSPWAAFAFSSLEALVQTGVFPLMAVLMTIHPLAFGNFMS